MKKFLLPVTLLLAIALSACSGALAQLQSAATQVVGAATQASGGVGGSGASGSVLLQDDFSNPDSGWDRTTQTEGSTDYEQGGYRIFVNSTNYSVWANPNQTSYTDTRVEVDAQKIGGDDNNEFGIVCRHADPSNYYVGVITSDGYFGFWKRVDGGDLQVIGRGEDEGMPTSDVIHLGSEDNHIRLDCVGSTLTLYANGSMLGSATDSDISNGDVGLYAGTFDVAGTDVLFDNFVVYQP